MNNENLKPIKNTREAKEKGKNGGIKSAKSKKQRKLIKEYINDFLSEKVVNPELKKQVEDLNIGIDLNELDNKMMLVIAQWQQAIKGNTKAFENLMNYAGEKPVEQVQEITPPVIIDFDDVSTEELRKIVDDI